MRSILIIAAILVGLAVSGPSFAEQQIPKKSFDSLSEIFTMVGADLWLQNDEFFHAGEFERCIASLRLITCIDPYDTTAYQNCAWLLQNQLRDDEGEAFLLQGLDKNRDCSDIYSEIGSFYYQHERPEESVTYYEQAMIMDAPTITWHQLAHSYEQAGYVNEALNIWIQLQIIENGDPVPQIQINRITSGEPPADTPRFLSRAREERRKNAGME